MDVNKRWEKLLEAVPQLERLEEERAMVTKDIDKLYFECAGVGLHVGAIRKILAMRRMNAAERQSEDAHLAIYMMVLAGDLPPDDLWPGEA